MESIRVLRTRAGWSQRELAERLGVDRTAIVKYENGDGEPSLRLAIRIADLFGVSMDELLGRKVPEKSADVGQENPLIRSEARQKTERGQPAERTSPAAKTWERPPVRSVPEEEDPQLFLMIHELSGMNPAVRQRVADFMAGIRAASGVETGAAQSKPGGSRNV